MFPAEDVLEGARVIRRYLPDLLGVEAMAVDRTLAELLAKAETGAAVDNQIIDLLAKHDATREWAWQFLQDKVPPPVMKSFDPRLAGSVSLIEAETFICEEAGCPWHWYRPKAGVLPPLCPRHKKPLVPAQAKQS